MTKEEIIKLYLADLNNLVVRSDAQQSRIAMLEEELEANKISSNALLADSSPLLQQDKEDGILLLNRLKNISIMQTDEAQIKRMLTLIDATGFEIKRKQ